MKKPNIYIGSDHGGFLLKQELIKSLDLPLSDEGCFSEDSVDYPDIADKVCRKVLNNPLSYGILICKTGIGMSIAANRYLGIRAALCYAEEVTELSRNHNNSNVICLGANFITLNDAVTFVNTFLTTNFEGGRHQRRVEKLDNIEQKITF